MRSQRNPHRIIARTKLLPILIAFTLLSGFWVNRHFELLSSYPQKDQTLARAPIDISLVFSESADSARTSISLAGPNGTVTVGPIRVQDEKLVVLAKVEGAISAGRYTVSWVSGAPQDDLVKGTFRFTVRADR